METRNRSRRVGPAPPPQPPPPPVQTRRAARNTRREPVASSAAAGSQRETRQTKAKQDLTESANNAGLTTSQIPRRGARPSGRAGSIASIATVPPRADDETELGEEDKSSQSSTEPEPQSEPQSELRFDEDDEEGDDEDIDDETRLQIMAYSIKDLAKTADDVFKLLEQANYNNKLFRGLLKMKIAAFVGIRKVYEEPQTAPFIEWTQLADMETNTAQARPAAQTMVAANIATALQEVQSIQAGQQPDIAPLLNGLCQNFPDLFFCSEEQMPNPQLTLDIRTQYLIYRLEKAKGRVKTQTAVAAVFCEESDEDLAVRFSRGPYRSLGGNVDDTEELCAVRITEIMSITGMDSRSTGYKKLKNSYPLDEFLDKLRSCLMETYIALRPVGDVSQGRAGLEPDVFHDAEEEIGSQVDSDSESQSIIPAPAGETGQTMFRDLASVKYLHGHNTSVPSSNQQQAGPLPGAPVDYGEHSNRDLLETPPPGSTPYARPAGAKRRYDGPAEAIEEEDEDEEDAFETDTRPVDKGKRAAISASLPPAKRPRGASPPQAARYAESAAASVAASSEAAPSQPPPIFKQPPALSMSPRPSLSSAGTQAMPPPSSLPNFDAIREEKRLLSQRARQARQELAGPASLRRQRHPWSDADCLTLLDLVRERQAAWASMENHDKHRFQLPRNQQAYRDKARNMKVDYLMTDAVLPPCFDLVALGQKEVDRLIGMGKNPYRKESDIDQETGVPINISY